ncbi:MAG TPA: peptidylprolyl isomerase [Candidatus Saccharimonadales bacterium]|nr:peptidylprolyl isomerase [Candidatus Saccharimonadales bacterium]
MSDSSNKTNPGRLSKVRNIIPPVPKRFKRVRGEERIQEAFQNIPNITNETVAEHREDVLKGARKYKYPLQHSKHRIVIVSTGLLIFAVLAFFVYVGLALYKFQSSSSFIYRVTQVLPLPVAKAGSHFVTYENYLFELRRYKHYYQTQQRVDFGAADGQRQLDKYKPVAMNEVVQAAYVKQLAAQYHVSVSSGDVDAEISSLQAQNQSSKQELADVTNKFFGWSLDDLKREIKQELLAQRVAAKLDTDARARADAVLAQLVAGGDFTTLAADNSDDASTKANGGQYANTAITSASADVPSAVVRQLKGMQVGQVSGVIQAGGAFEIVKLIANSNGKLTAAHIAVNINSVDTYVSGFAKKHPSHVFIQTL